MQLQALLCRCPRDHVTDSGDHMTSVAGHVEGCVQEGMLGELSLKLLTWPHTGKMKEVSHKTMPLQCWCHVVLCGPQAVKLVFESSPVLTVEYCESYFPAQLSCWKDLLDMLLQTCTSSDKDSSHLLPLPGSTPSPDPPPPLHTYLSLYRGECWTNW